MQKERTTGRPRAVPLDWFINKELELDRTTEKLCNGQIEEEWHLVDY